MKTTTLPQINIECFEIDGYTIATCTQGDRGGLIKIFGMINLKPKQILNVLPEASRGINDYDSSLDMWRTSTVSEYVRNAIDLWCSNSLGMSLQDFMNNL